MKNRIMRVLFLGLYYDDCIGSSIILPGVRLKKGTIVGAGAVVTKTFPAYSILGGNPAKLIRTRT